MVQKWREEWPHQNPGHGAAGHASVDGQALTSESDGAGLFASRLAPTGLCLAQIQCGSEPARECDSRYSTNIRSSRAQ
ncbi:hypothetical protein CXF97_25360 [Pseudomonas sp. Choline-02u-1]|nr:hypothetical protein CXF97_25360 [Pseudomonas sp. Choline-02u-1]